MPLTLTYKTTGPATEPVTTAEAKSHAQVTASGDDDLIDSYVKAARLWAEAFTKRQLITAVWELRGDSFAALRDIGRLWGGDGSGIIVPRPPFAVLNSIAYTDSNGDAQTWASSKYQADLKSAPGRIKPIEGESFPSTQAGTYNAVTVDFDAGYGAASAVPENFKDAIRMIVAQWYEIRLPVSKMNLTDVPNAARSLLMQDRVFCM
jgi:uncharacterized phiE125 gp8 family phage protein